MYKDRRVPEYYSADEISKILSSIDRGNPLGKRNYAMILLGVKYGLRISDIRTLKLSDISFEKNIISIIQQKTGKPLSLDLLPDVGWAIIDYLKYGRPNIEATEVFCSPRPPLWSIRRI
ncbi:tyrosine-type recombinase/integrase [Lacrimispora xylanisolvens]|uniref:tyrosine-type recombinase/integrase n=1 Tax=Lacrimispora xylanisolvens TaxID=384636 RepID=UPI003D9CA546